MRDVRVLLRCLVVKIFMQKQAGPFPPPKSVVIFVHKIHIILNN